jgi:hypothetical protein
MLDNSTSRNSIDMPNKTCPLAEYHLLFHIAMLNVIPECNQAVSTRLGRPVYRITFRRRSPIEEGRLGDGNTLFVEARSGPAGHRVSFDLTAPVELEQPETGRQMSPLEWNVPRHAAKPVPILPPALVTSGELLFVVIQHSATSDHHTYQPLHFKE